MAPAQAFVDIEAEIPEISLKSISQREIEDIFEVNDEENFRCTDNCEDSTFDMETLFGQDQVEETDKLDVDIAYCTDTTGMIVQEEDPDATEYSSSFGGTISGSQEGLKFNSSDVEVESQYHVENEASAIFYGFSRLFPLWKRRLTVHWRRYIRPLMWRCKWIELKVKELQLQASKYDQELLAYANEKQARMGEVAIQSSVARSMPLFGQSHRQKAMKRRKRTRMEETVDIPSYLQRHNLFAYYENKKHEADGGAIDDDRSNQVTPANMPNNYADDLKFIPESFQHKSGDGNSSLEQFLWNIELLQSRVAKLKTQLDKVVSKNVGQSSSMENLSNCLPNDFPSASTLSPTISPANGGQMPVGALYMSPSHHISEYEIGDLVMTGSAVSSFGDATPLPDVIESTVGLLSAADRSLDLPLSGESPEYFADDILIHKHAVEEELHDFETVALSGGRLQEPFKGHDNEKVGMNVSTPETDPMPPLTSAEEPEEGSALKDGTDKSISRTWLAHGVSAPKSKRKRMALKTGSGRWNHGKVYKRRRSK
ncbi:uncharacterized protein [Aristolochia californica]|uniref:uncharacterized protein n=1 Tax=Aristolochia californica TaxID=171875 RepID=UPI0035D719C1